MKIVHLVHRLDPPVLVRSQTKDALLLQDRNEVETWSIRDGRILTPRGNLAYRQLAVDLERSGAEVCHFYTRRLPPAWSLKALRVPWIAPTAATTGGWFLRREIEPTRRVAPHPGVGAPHVLPEAVDDRYFEIPSPGGEPVVGVILNDCTRPFHDAVRSRIIRYRDDVRWHTFDAVPTPDELAGITCWVDLGVDSSSEETGIPESLVAGRAVVAPRNEMNRSRLLDGSAGFLVPEDDANELVHVLLTALFKPEIAAHRIETALASRNRFRTSVRLAELESLYEAIGRNER